MVEMMKFQLKGSVGRKSDDEYVEVGTPTVLDLFNIELAKKSQEFGKKFKPFDEPCCRIDFRDKLESAERESERKFGFIRGDIEVVMPNFESYADVDRFEFLEDQEDYTDKVIEGSRTQVIVGHTLSYKCKARGHKVAVFVPISEYNLMKSDKSKKIAKEEK